MDEFRENVCAAKMRNEVLDEEKCSKWWIEFVGFRP